MISFSQNMIQEFKEKIVFAPNGFGKTTLSKNIKDSLDKLNPEKTLLFTRRKMDELVTFDKTNFYFGDTAVLKLKISNIRQKVSDSKIFKDFVVENYNVKSGSALTAKSLFFRLAKVKNLKTESLLNVNFYDNISNDYGISEAITLDSILNIEEFDLINPSLFNCKEFKFKKTKTYISETIYQFLSGLSLYAAEEKLNECPLCGNYFKDNLNLQKAIQKKFTNYELLPLDDPSAIVLEIFNAIFLKLFNCENKIVKDIFDGIGSKQASFTEKVKVLVNFYNLCVNNNSIISRTLKSLKIENQNLSNLLEDIEISKNKIINSKENISYKRKALDLIKTQFESITKYSDAELNLDYENFSISIISNDGKPLRVYDTLSESELKRLSLAVIKTKIRYSNYDCLILDDPIDSYDDYYLVIVCNYIVDLLREKKLTNGYYIFTNNYLALFNLSKSLHCQSVVYYEDPDDVFINKNPKNYNYLYLSASYKEIEYLNQNELVLLNGFLNPNRHTYNSNCNLSFLAFLTTLRNIKSEIILKFSRIKIGKKKDDTKHFENGIKNNVEHCYMHFEPGLDKRINNSNTVSVGEIAILFTFLTKISNDEFEHFINNNESITKLRRAECYVPFINYNKNSILALILKKILFVSELKYEFEEILLDKLYSKFNFSISDIESIANTDKGVEKKLDEAKRINRLNGYGAEGFLDDMVKTHRANSNIVNEFDHALAKMFPPYLNTRIFDIKKYKEEIDKLKNKY